MRTRIAILVAFSLASAGALLAAAGQTPDSGVDVATAGSNDPAPSFGDQAEADEPVSAEPAISTTTTAPPAPATDEPPGPTTTTMAVTRTQVLRDPAKAWTLNVVEQHGSRCVEFVAGRSTTGSLLCDAAPATAVVGDLVTFETPLGMVFVAVVDPLVERGDTNLPGMAPTSSPGFAAAADARHPGMAYAAGVFFVGRYIGPGTVDVWWLSGDERLGHTTLAIGPSVVPGGETTFSGSPYGHWPNYRRAGSTGFFWGGDEEVGFYDGPDGLPCLLYRRFGGSAEALLADVCPGPAAAGGLAYAALEPPTLPLGASAGYVVAIVDNPAVDRWVPVLHGQASPLPGPYDQHTYVVLADPAGTGRKLLAHFPGPLSLSPFPGPAIDIIAMAGSTEVGRATIDLPAG